MKNLYFVFIYIISVWALQIQAADVKGKVSLEGETFNFELSGQKNWDYDLKRINEKGQAKVQLFVKAIDQALLNKIANVENPFVKGINVTQNAIDSRWLIEFILKSDSIETFDYLTDQPSKLIIDFYKGEAPVPETSPKVLAKAAVAVNPTPVAKKKSLKKGKAERKPADADILTISGPEGIETSVLARSGLYDASDSQFSRFAMKESDYKEEAVIKSHNNYYLKFPALESEFSFWKKMKENPPLYEIQPDSSDENKEARLLKTLFVKKRYLVFIQTAEWFRKKYPTSKYEDLISYMLGDAFAELWRAEKIKSMYEQAQNAYRDAQEKHPEAILAERTSLLTGMLAIENSDYMSAIRKLNAHIENKKYENKISIQYAKIGLAYSYSKINKLEDALNFLTNIEKNTKDQLVLTEVAVRRGDFNFFSKKFAESIAAYDIATKNFPLVSKLYPSAYFNKMEAQFWTGKYQNSHLSAIDFAQYFPTHDFAPYALTRVGELLDIMGADQAKSVGAYLETHFRYGDSPKTIVARLHLLSTKMKSIKSEQLEQTLVKMDELALKSELQNVDQFKVTMISDGFSRRKEYLRAIDILSKFYQQNPTRIDAKQVTQRIAKNVNDQLKYLSDQKKYPELLKTYRQYSDTWIKTHSRVDTDFFLGLSYEYAGAFEYAIEKYKKVLDGMTAIKGTAAEKEIYINQYLPSFDSLHLKLAKNSFDNISYQDAFQYLEKIQTPLALTEAEQVERVQLASQLYEQKGDSVASVRYLSDLSTLWKGDEKLSLPVQFKLADVQAQKSNIAEAISAFEKCRAILLKDEKPLLQDLQQLLNSYSKLLIDQQKEDQAIVLLNEVIQKHGQNFNLDHERYILGDLQFKKGELKKAEATWQNIKNEKSTVWRQLSQEKLKQAAWDSDFQKHLKRIPAMTQLEGQKK